MDEGSNLENTKPFWEIPQSNLGPHPKRFSLYIAGGLSLEAIKQINLTGFGDHPVNWQTHWGFQSSYSLSSLS